MGEGGGDKDCHTKKKNFFFTNASESCMPTTINFVLALGY